MRNFTRKSAAACGVWAYSDDCLQADDFDHALREHVVRSLAPRGDGCVPCSLRHAARQRAGCYV